METRRFFKPAVALDERWAYWASLAINYGRPE